MAERIRSGADEDSRPAMDGLGGPWAQELEHCLLVLREVEKVYGATRAIDRLSLGVAVSSVHAVVGENGAGKSTAAQIAAGVVQPTSGSVEFENRAVTFGSARDAEALGIVLIPQELQLYESLSVAENLYVGRVRPRLKAGLIRGKDLQRRAEAQLAKLGVSVDVSRIVRDLNHGNRQLVAIARALILDTRVLIMDEPTASLDEWEAQRLLGVVETLRSHGVGIIYVSHRMPEILQIADTVTVMRDGRAVAHGARSEFDEAALVTNMLGRTLTRLEKRKPRTRPEVALRTKGLTRRGEFDRIDLTVHAGEVVGMAGLVGSGRSEFAQAVFGRSVADSGEVEVMGASTRIRSVRRAISLGVGYVPEERQSQGLFLPLSSRSNVSISALGRLTAAGVISRSQESSYVNKALERLRVKGSVDAAVGTLSGGTQQKVLLGRWLALQPRVLIMDEPTRGIDVGTRAEIYQLIEELTQEGVAILLISSDLQELMQLSDRVVVMRGGRLVAEFTGPDLTEMNVGAAALGAVAPDGGPA